MADIKVPIGRGIIGQVVEQRMQAKRKTQALGDLQFRQELADEGRLVLESGTVTVTGTAVVITPPTGTTFFFLEAFFSALQVDQLTTINLVKAGATVDAVTFLTTTGAEGKFHLTFDKLVGNSSDTFQADVINQLATSVSVTICGYFENTVSFRE